MIDVQNGATGAVNGIQPPESPATPEPTTKEKE